MAWSGDYSDPSELKPLQPLVGHASGMVRRDLLHAIREQVRVGDEDVDGAEQGGHMPLDEWVPRRR
jgi:hypothetical protein